MYLRSLRKPLRDPLTIPIVSTLLVLLCLQSGIALAKDPYVRVDVGVFSLDLSESSPFIRTGGDEKVLSFLKHYDASDESGARIGLVVGGLFDMAGEDRRVEFDGFYASYNTRDVHEHNEDPEPWANVRSVFEQQHCQDVPFTSCLGKDTEPFLVAMIKNDPDVRSVGWIGRIDGGAMPFGSPNFAWGDPIRITTKRDVEFFGGDLVVEIPLQQTEASLFVGPSFQRINQETDVFAYESNREPDVNNMTLSESLEGSYYGAVVNMRVATPLEERWGFTLDGRAGVYYLDAEYAGFQRTQLTSSVTPLIEVTRLKTDDSEITSIARIQVSLDFTAQKGLMVRLGAGAEYLSDVPRMRYAQIGESFASGNPHTPARIEYSDAHGYFGTLSIVVGL